MPRPRFSLAGLFLSVTFSALVLALLVPMLHVANRLARPSPVVIGGFGVWFFTWLILRSQRNGRPCQTCGKPFAPAGKKDTNVDCPTCRALRRKEGLTPKARRSENRRSIVIAACFWLPVAVAGAWLVAIRLDDMWRLPFVAIFVGTFVAWFAGVPLALVGALRLKWRIDQRRRNRQANDVALAERCAGVPGAVESWGQLSVWWAASDELAGEFKRAWEEARSRLVAVAGQGVGCGRPVRVFGFGRCAAVEEYLVGHGIVTTGDVLPSFYFPDPWRKLVLCEETLRQSVVDSAIDLRSLSMIAMLPTGRRKGQPLWLATGLPQALSHDDQHGELGRLNRRVMSALARGGLSEDTEWLNMTYRRLWREHAGTPSAAAWNGFLAQSTSFAEFLCGHGSTPARRAAFASAYQDPLLGRGPERAFANHFGIALSELLANWRAWVEEQGIGEHVPLAPELAEKLRGWPVAIAADPNAKTEERLWAIRRIATAGYALGADALILIVRDGPVELREEAVWALETISGHAWGSDIEHWDRWWNELPAEVK